MTAISSAAATTGAQAATDKTATNAANSTSSTTSDAQTQQLETAVATDVFSILLTLVLNQVGGDQ